MPALASVSAVHAPDGPPPMTATRRGRSSTAPSLTARTDRAVALRLALHFCALNATRCPVNWLAELVLALRPLICLQLTFASGHVCSNTLALCIVFACMIVPNAAILANGNNRRKATYLHCDQTSSSSDSDLPRVSIRSIVSASVHVMLIRPTRIAWRTCTSSFAMR